MLPFTPTAPRAAVARPALSRCLTNAIFLVKASRPGFYLTALWFYLLPFGSQMPLGNFAFWVGAFYVTFPLGMFIYAGNDIGDAQTDRLNPRKDSWLFGARPTDAQIASLPLYIALVQLPFALLFTCWLGPRALVWFAALFTITALYNAPGFAAKNRPGVDVLAQIGYLLVFVLANWLSNAPLSPWPIYVFGALFAMHSHLFGQILDLAPDRAAKRRTSATVIGARASKGLIAALLGVESIVTLQIADKPWLAPALLLAAIVFALDALCGWREKPYATWMAMGFFAGFNAVLVGEIALSAVWARGMLPGF